MTARYAFGSDANRRDDSKFCCAPDCEMESVIQSGMVPLCETHVIAAYRRIGEYLRSKPEHPDNGPNAALGQTLKVYEIIGRPHGRCPRCDWLTLIRHRETNDVICMQTAECGFSVTAAEFQAFFDDGVKAYREEVVYYVRFGDRVKIGTTKDLEARIASIPHDEVMATESGGVYVERQRHKQFKHLRAHAGRGREWFKLTPELAEHIAAIKARQLLAPQ